MSREPGGRAAGQSSARKVGIGTVLFAQAVCLSSLPLVAQSVIDSAGVRIIESRSPRERWELSRQPSFQVGLADGDSSFLFDEVGAALRLDDGTVIVANCADPVLRWFGSDGSFIRATGRTGPGPGEFGAGECRRSLQLWRLPGESVGTWDHSRRRIKVFDRDGKFVRELGLERDAPIQGVPSIVGRFGDGGFAVGIRDPMAPPPVGEIWRDSITYHHFRADGSYGGRIVRLEGWPWVSWDFQLPEGIIRNPSGRPFAARAATASGGEHFYYTSGDRFDIRVYGRDGGLRRIIRRSEQPRPLTPQIRDAYRRARAAGMQTRHDSLTLARMERLLGSREFPETIATYTELRVDRDTLLWARAYPLPGDRNVTWSVFDPAGRWLAEIEIPRSFQVLEVGRGYAIGLVRDSLGVEQVRSYGVLGQPPRSAR